MTHYHYTHWPRPLRAIALPLLLALVASLGLTGCDDGSSNADVIVAGVNLTQLFAPPTAAEIQAVSDEWATRDPQPVNPEIVGEVAVDGAQVIVLRHEMPVPGSTTGETFPHYGVVRIPDGAANAPVLVVHHGGDEGFDLATMLETLALFPTITAGTVQVIPVYRSEVITATYSGLEPVYQAGGPASPWDYDVDDALALTEAALQLFDAETDPVRIGALGFSRGGNVALLTAVRDPRIEVVTEYFAPTDFFDASLQPLATGLLLNSPEAFDLPGAPYLLERVLRPLGAGTLSLEAARLEVVRRSSALFTSRLPALQVHHHRLDGTVPYEQAVALDARRAAAPNQGAYEFYLYDNPLPDGVSSGHSVEAMPGSTGETDAFLAEHLLEPAFVGGGGF